MTALTALDRLRRLLAAIPWVAERDGPHIDEIVARFDYPRSELLEDLEHVLFFVGVHPFTPDCLIDVTVADERVWIRYADWFRRPMRLGAAETMALYAAGRSVAAMTAGDELGPLERALTKLASGMGSGVDLAVEVRLGAGSADLIDVIRTAVADSTSVDIDYYSYGRDAAAVTSLTLNGSSGWTGSAVVPLRTLALAGPQQQTRPSNTSLRTDASQRLYWSWTPNPVGLSRNTPIWAWRSLTRIG